MREDLKEAMLPAGSDFQAIRAFKWKSWAADLKKQENASKSLFSTHLIRRLYSLAEMELEILVRGRAIPQNLVSGSLNFSPFIFFNMELALTSMGLSMCEYSACLSV